MGENSKIEWTDHSWNPWVGCKKVSQGCKNCYMFRDQTRYGQDPTDIRITSAATFKKPLSWHEPAMVFTCSWSDFFIEEADDWRSGAWNIIRLSPQLTFQILTKRPENIAERLPDDWGDGWPNIWLGTSVENQEMADERIPHLLKIPAKVRFLSCEPLLGPIDLTYINMGTYWFNALEVRSIIHGIEYGIDWVIVGGESGPNRRPMKLEWARSIRDQCQAVRVPFFGKQWDKVKPLPPDLMIREFPKIAEVLR